jgi:2-keto-4-pentenoate hydratase/2-oxohepta-3-ene-1,7-dioic acid hydratase in catechol pathway
MRICRFRSDRLDGARLGIVADDAVWDVTAALEMLPARRWPYPRGDALIAQLDSIRPALAAARSTAQRIPLADARLLSPVANPQTVIAAPLNYRRHLAEAAASREINHGTHVPDFEGYATPIDKLGLFIKASSSVVGAGEGVHLTFPERRNDHELELVVVIGRECRNVDPAHAREAIAGYAIGLDMTVRGPEDRSYRKSLDGFSVLGPWLVTADEIDDPGALDFELRVGGAVRQQGNTRDLLVGIDGLVARASRAFRLYPGDLLFTGTAEGVAEVKPGDRLDCRIERIGEMRVAIH